MALPCDIHGKALAVPSEKNHDEIHVVTPPVTTSQDDSQVVFVPKQQPKKSLRQIRQEEEEEARQKRIDRWIARGTLVVGVLLLMGGIITLSISLLQKQDDDEQQDQDEEVNTGRLMGILALAGGIVMTSWGWLLKNSSDIRQESANTNTTTTTEGNTTAADENVDDSSSPERQTNKNQPSQKPPPRPLMRNRLNDERAPGELVFDKLIVGGTLSLGVLMFVGGLAILIISLVNQSAYKDVSLDDFASLGPQGCRIDSSVSYRVETEKLDALNSICKEVYQYQVEIIRPTTKEKEEADGSMSPTATSFFISTPLYRIMCKTSCDICPPSSLNGPNFYVGVDVTRPGTAITANETLVECWEPTRPVNQLSDYYQCGPTQVDNGGQVPPSSQGATPPQCYQLYDTAAEIQDLQGSHQAGLIAGSIGFAGSIILTIVGLYFVHRNRQARKEVVVVDERSSSPAAAAVISTPDENERRDEEEGQQVRMILLEEEHPSFSSDDDDEA